MTETPEVRLKRLRIRAWRRGTKEMDLILGGYADAHLDRMDASETRRLTPCSMKMTRTSMPG